MELTPLIEPEAIVDTFSLLRFT